MLHKFGRHNLVGCKRNHVTWYSFPIGLDSHEPTAECGMAGEERRKDRNATMLVRAVRVFRYSRLRMGRLPLLCVSFCRDEAPTLSHEKSRTVGLFIPR